MGKAEGRKELWHGHVTAVTVAPEYRRLGVAKQLMDSLETVSMWDAYVTAVGRVRDISRRFFVGKGIVRTADHGTILCLVRPLTYSCARLILVEKRARKYIPSSCISR